MIRKIITESIAGKLSQICLKFIQNKFPLTFEAQKSTVEPPRSGHHPRPDMIFYEILTNIIYTSIGENIQHNKKQKKLKIKAGMILVHMSAQCPDLREYIFCALDRFRM